MIRKLYPRDQATGYATRAPVIPGATPAVTNPQPTTIRLRWRSSQPYHREGGHVLTSLPGATLSLDPGRSVVASEGLSAIIAGS
jgi:hypothetical protein